MLTIDQARTIIRVAFETAAEHGMNPLGVTVLDAGGHLVAFERQDGTPFGRFEVGHGKAFGAVAMGLNSRMLGDMAIDRPHFMQGVNGSLGGQVVPVPGGVLIKDADGATLGAVGVSGDTSDNDEICAIAGIQAAGLRASGART